MLALALLFVAVAPIARFSPIAAFDGENNAQLAVGPGGAALLLSRVPRPDEDVKCTFGVERIEEPPAAWIFHDPYRVRLRKFRGGQLAWARELGAEVLYARAVFSRSNTFLAGSFEGRLSLDRRAPRAVGADTFVTRLDANGAPRWTRVFSSDALEHHGPIDLVADGSGGVFVAGDFTDNIELRRTHTCRAQEAAGGYSSRARGWFIARLSAEGTILWARTFCGDNGGNRLHAIAANSSAELAAIAADGEERAMWLLKFDARGRAVWEIRGSENTFGTEVAIDRAGDVTAALSRPSDPARLGYANLNLLVSYDARGLEKWRRVLPSHTLAIHALLARDDGGIAAGGLLVGPLAIDGRSVETTRGQAVLIELSRDGELRELVAFDSPNGSDIQSLDAIEEHLSIAGSFAGSLVIASSTVTQSSNYGAIFWTGTPREGSDGSRIAGSNDGSIDVMTPK